MKPGGQRQRSQGRLPHLNLAAAITTCMGTVHNFAPATPGGNEQRVAPRRHVLMRASMRVPGSDQVYAITVKDISSTGLRARTAVSIFPGSKLEIELPNIGWIAAQVVRAEEGLIAVRFAAVIDPDRTQPKVTGSYAPPPSVTIGAAPLFRV